MPPSATSEPSVLAEIIGMIRFVLHDPDLELTTRSTPDEVPGWDSMAHITLIVEAEHRFGVQFQPTEIEALYSVGELVRAIEAKRSCLAAFGRRPAGIAVSGFR